MYIYEKIVELNSVDDFCRQRVYGCKEWIVEQKLVPTQQFQTMVHLLKKNYEYMVTSCISKTLIEEHGGLILQVEYPGGQGFPEDIIELVRSIGIPRETDWNLAAVHILFGKGNEDG